MQKLRNTLSCIAIFIFCALLLPTALSAAEDGSVKTRSILVAGDAVSSGKGLSDRAGKSYGALVASEYGISGGRYKNIASDFMSSGNMIDDLTYRQLEIEDADLMIISVGADDIMSIITSAIEMTTDDKMTYPKLLQLAADPDYIRRLNDAIDHTALLNAAAKYWVNVGEIILRAEKFNPEIRIVFLSIYNPLDGTPALAPLSELLTSPISLMNESLRKAADENGCHVIDLEAAFAGKTSQLTNLTSLDPSPNAEAHALIAGLLTEYISTLPSLPEPTTEPPVTSSLTDEPPVTDTGVVGEETTGPISGYKKPGDKSRLWVYIAIALFSGSVGVAVGAYSVKRKMQEK